MLGFFCAPFNFNLQLQEKGDSWITDTNISLHSGKDASEEFEMLHKPGIVDK